MKNPRHQFVLLGFLAQSLVWDSVVAMVLYMVLWVLCLSVLRGRVNISVRTEALVLLLGCVFSYGVAKMFNRSAHFFLGEGLIFLQAVRLVRPLNQKEKLTSILIACFHFGVVCTLAPNVRFVVLFLAAVGLFPRALRTLQLEDFAPEENLKATLSWPHYTALLMVSVFLFFSLPRFFTGAPIFARSGEQSLLDSVLDPTRSGSENSDRVLLQIEGEKVGYLRCYSLTEFDGVRWSMEKHAPLRNLRVPQPGEAAKLLRREVRVKNALALGRVIPTDGNVRWVKGNFFSRPVENFSCMVESGMMWNTANNSYEYLVDEKPFLDRLSSSARKHLTWHPEQSQRLKDWLAKAEEGGTNQLHKARMVERFLRNSFTYKIGTPELNRINPVEDFIFNRTEGHCERFAAAMALFLRMQGVPSRVVIGYAATTQNPFTGWRQVRFKDAHSWTEGYFDDIGWVQFDATPGPPQGGTGMGWREMLEALDFAWYSHVVNFDGLAQKQFFTSLPSTIAETGEALLSGQKEIIVGVVLLLALLLVRRQKGKSPGLKIKKSAGSGRVAHHYGKMLQLLEKHGYTREPGDTPKEFIENLRRENFPHLEEAIFVTDSFCRTAYGGREPAKVEIDQMETKLHELKRSMGKTSIPSRLREEEMASGPPKGFR